MDKDGFYIYYYDQYKMDGNSYIRQQWTEKYTYSYEDRDFIYSFTFDSFIKLYDKDLNKVIEGEWYDLGLLYPESNVLSDEKTFDETRRLSIITALEEKMSYYISRYNHIASQFGVSYTFTLPAIEDDVWNRTIDDVSIFVLFQGYPYGYGTLDTYNKYAYGGARVLKSSAYFITMEDGISYYHKDKCNKVTDKAYPIYDKKICAESGAFACDQCKP